MDELSEDIGRLSRKWGSQKVRGYLKRLTINAKEIPSGSRRAILNFLKASYTPDVIISESYLRSDIKLGNTSQITFSINESDGGNVTSTSLRLNQNDTFEAVSGAIFIYRNLKDTATAPLSTADLQTYPNPNVFTGAGEAPKLNAIFNAGRLSIKMGTTTLFPTLDLLRFFRVPITQKGTAVSTVAGTGVVKNDAYMGEEYPFAPFVPNITFSGNGKNQIQINLAEGIDLTAVDPLYDNYAVLYLRGFLCANGAKQTNKKFSPQ